MLIAYCDFWEALQSRLFRLCSNEAAVPAGKGPVSDMKADLRLKTKSGSADLEVHGFSVQFNHSQKTCCITKLA